MNKTDKLKEALQGYDAYETDPDNIMMLTTDEWALAKSEKVDTFDEDELYLRQMIDALEILDEKIMLIKADIKATEDLMQKYAINYQMKYEYQKDLNELNHSLLIAENDRSKILEKYLAFKESYDNKITRF